MTKNDTTALTHISFVVYSSREAKYTKLDSLMSMGKTADAGTVSIFTKDDVTVYDETDVLITCKNKPILIGVRDNKGRYRIPLVQQ